MDTLFQILRKLQTRYPGFSKRLVEAEALGRWELAVGSAIAKHSRAVRVVDGILWVEVDHPIWMSELHHRKHQILTKLNDQKDSAVKASAPPLQDVRFFLGGGN